MASTPSETDSVVGSGLGASDDRSERSAGARATHDLIASDKIEGTAVRRSGGEHLGQIERLMIDKRSGQVAYAVMSFGGFLGIGTDFFPVPWQKLSYNEQLDAYELDISDEQLRAAPRYSKADAGAASGTDHGRDIYDYYGVSPYWGL